MKKKTLLIATLGAALFTGCEKADLTPPLGVNPPPTKKCIPIQISDSSAKAILNAKIDRERRDEQRKSFRKVFR